MEQVVDTVEKALLKSNIIVQEKSTQIENLKAEFEIFFQDIQRTVSELRKKVEDRNESIIKYQVEISHRDGMIEALEGQVKELSDEITKLEWKRRTQNESSSWTEEADSDNGRSRSRSRKLHPLRILKVGNENYSREFYFEPIQNSKGVVILKIYEYGSNWTSHVAVEMALIQRLIQNISNIFHQSSTSMYPMQLDMTVKNDRKYSLEIRDEGEDRVLRIATGPGSTKQIEIPEGVHEKFQHTLIKYVNDFNIDNTNE